MRTSNPIFSDRVFNAREITKDSAEVMTVQGTVNKTAIALAIVVAAAAWTWHMFNTPGLGAAAVMPWAIGGAIGGLILALVTAFKATWSPYTVPFYALCEGLLLGALSALFETRYPGIAAQAVGLTFGTLFCLLALYKTGLIRATEKFKMGVFAATGAIGLIYLVTWILSFFSIQVPHIYGSGWIGIGFSLVVVVIAALNLVLDFDFIERGAQKGAPKYLEWYGAFGLLVTLIWLYIEILRLLAKLRDRR